MANRMVWLKIVLGEYFTLIKRLGFEISIKNRVRTAKKVIKQPLGYLKNISSSHIFKADRIANLERPRIPNYLYWFRRYEFQKLNEKIRKLSENQFFIFLKQKNNFATFMQSTFFEGPIEVYFVQKFQVCISNGLEDMAKSVLRKMRKLSQKSVFYFFKIEKYFQEIPVVDIF